MKNLFLTILFSLLGLQIAFADVSLIAVLNHEGEITTFTSSNSFQSAVDAAVDGDAITLSSGNFVAVDIKKNLTIRGAGMMPGENPTILNGKFTIDIDPKNTGSLTLEGLYIPNDCSINQANEVTFLKCHLSIISAVQNDLAINSIRGIHCFITSYFSITNKDNCKSIEFINSFLQSAQQDYKIGCNFTNCVINICFAGRLANYTNCILLSHSGSATFNNCVSNKNQFLGQPVTAGNKYMPEITDFFKKNSQVYELKDDYKDILIGNDGTQVGIYGGSLPFTPQTTSLKITKFKVASKTTADGKLPIEISIDAN